MFDVIHVCGKKQRTVYAVRINDNGETEFLFYNYFGVNKWEWESSALYEIYEDFEDEDN